MNSTLKTDILILGAGIGGYEAFRVLSKLIQRHGLKKTITIVDQNNYFTFTPLLHEVASGAVEPIHAALPLRELVAGTTHQFIKAKIDHINPGAKTVETDSGKITYDYCVVALGSQTNYYGVPGAEKFSYHVRTLASTMKLRHNLISRLEGEASEVKLTIVGGGYTGVELAGQLAYFNNKVLKKLYPNQKIVISLVHGGAKLAEFLPPRAQTKIKKRLEKMGVIFYFNSAVKEVKPNELLLANGGNLVSNFTVWCTGFENMAACFLDDPFCFKGRMMTTNYLNHASAPALYAVGDIAYNCNQGDACPQPQLGEAAQAGGRYAARHITAMMLGKKIKPFRFKSKGTLMPIGDWWGVAIIGPFLFFGRFAWWLRRTVYLLAMPGRARKISIVLDWTLRIFEFGNIIMVEREKEKGPRYE